MTAELDALRAEVERLQRILTGLAMEDPDTDARTIACLMSELYWRSRQADQTRDAAQARATACEERARKAEAERDNAVTSRDDWRACALHGSRLVIEADDGADFAGGRIAAEMAIVWARDVAPARIDPAAGTGDHEREPGRNDEPAPVRVDPWLPRALRDAGLVPSCSVGRRVVTTGEVSVDCVIVTSPETALEPGEHVLGYEGRGVLVRVGS